MNQGTEWGLLMKKNRSQKSRASVPLSHCRDIPLQSFGSHIRPQPHGLGLKRRWWQENWTQKNKICLYCREYRNSVLFVFPSHELVMWNLHTLLKTLISMNGPLGGVNQDPADYVPLLTAYFPITWLVGGENHPCPLSHLAGKVAYLVSTQNGCHMDLWSAWLVFTHHHHLHQHQLPLHANPMIERVSWLLFGLLLCLFFCYISWLPRVVF